jgi:branched chain amino acid efflux pump
VTEIADPLGSALAIGLMGLATYACRFSGYALMGRVRITPRVERALRALPGSIVVATVLPLAAGSGPSAALALVAAVAAMKLARTEFAALAAGLATATLARAAGL